MSFVVATTAEPFCRLMIPKSLVISIDSFWKPRTRLFFSAKNAGPINVITSPRASPTSILSSFRCSKMLRLLTPRSFMWSISSPLRLPLLAKSPRPLKVSMCSSSRINATYCPGRCRMLSCGNTWPIVSGSLSSKSSPMMSSSRP